MKTDLPLHGAVLGKSVSLVFQSYLLVAADF